MSRTGTPPPSAPRSMKRKPRTPSQGGDGKSRRSTQQQQQQQQQNSADLKDEVARLQHRFDSALSTSNPGGGGAAAAVSFHPSVGSNAMATATATADSRSNSALASAPKRARKGAGASGMITAGLWTREPVSAPAGKENKAIFAAAVPKGGKEHVAGVGGGLAARTNSGLAARTNRALPGRGSLPPRPPANRSNSSKKMGVITSR